MRRSSENSIPMVDDDEGNGGTKNRLSLVDLRFDTFYTGPRHHTQGVSRRTRNGYIPMVCTTE